MNTKTGKDHKYSRTNKDLKNSCKIKLYRFFNEEQTLKIFLIDFDFSFLHHKYLWAGFLFVEKKHLFLSFPICIYKTAYIS